MTSERITLRESIYKMAGAQVESEPFSSPLYATALEARIGPAIAACNRKDFVAVPAVDQC
jgi:hypothetical protein